MRQNSELLRPALAAAGNSEVSPDGSQVANFTYAGALELFDAETGETLATRPGIDVALADRISDDWQRVTWLEPADNPEDGNEASVRDLASGELVSELPQCTIPSAISHDGSLVFVSVGNIFGGAACPDSGETTRVMEVESGRVLAGSRGSARGERRLQPAR